MAPTGNVEVRRDSKGKLHVFVGGEYVQAVQKIIVTQEHPDTCEVEITVWGRFVDFNTETQP